MMLAKFALLAATLAAFPAQAGTLLTVGGKQDQEYTISPGTAAAVAFTIGTAAQDVSFDAPIVCLRCSGGVYLNKVSVGPQAALSNTIFGEAFNTSVAQSPISLGNLDAGTYFLIVSVGASSTASAYWVGSSAFAATSMGATRGADFTSSDLASFVPNSNFKVTFGLGLNYTVSAADAVPVPEPSAWISMVVGLGLLGAGRHRRKNSAPMQGALPGGADVGNLPA